MKIGSEEIESVKVYKYLGFHLDVKLTMTRHVDEALISARRVFSYVKYLSKRWYGFNSRNLKLMTQSYVLSRMN